MTEQQQILEAILNTIDSQLWLADAYAFNREYQLADTCLQTALRVYTDHAAVIKAHDGDYVQNRIINKMVETADQQHKDTTP